MESAFEQHAISPLALCSSGIVTPHTHANRSAPSVIRGRLLSESVANGTVGGSLAMLSRSLVKKIGSLGTVFTGVSVTDASGGDGIGTDGVVLPEAIGRGEETMEGFGVAFGYAH
ncbi:hypothetical protein D9758_018937 [Tetrapyrgos nigripes]|uniref:Uncharacterized protein n=1 Tax=Tetrapyrgos nigripes TaxID=182062 RepID=A0A8H5B794_9AGAR|nr:hypothetical protein D9758_018937 [Tetrapyrgos nigripes]